MTDICRFCYFYTNWCRSFCCYTWGI